MRPARFGELTGVRVVVEWTAPFDDLPPLVVQVGDGRADYGAGHHARAEGQWRQVLSPRRWRWREGRCDGGCGPEGRRNRRRSVLRLVGRGRCGWRARDDGWRRRAGGGPRPRFPARPRAP